MGVSSDNVKVGTQEYTNTLAALETVTSLCCRLRLFLFPGHSQINQLSIQVSNKYPNKSQAFSVFVCIKRSSQQIAKLLE